MLTSITGSHGRVCGQFDDAVVILAEFQFASRAHHTVGYDTPNLGDLQRDIAAGHIGAGGTEHADQPRARIGGAADDLHRAVAGIDGEDLQLVRLRMALGGEDFCDAECGKLLAGILDAFDLEADAGERLDDLIERGGRVEMLAEPVEGEFHAPTPPDKVGTSSAEKP